MRRKKKQNDEPKVDDSWLLPYADMLTLLLALFIVLFAMSEIDAQRYEELGQVFKHEFATGGQGVLDYDEAPLDPTEEDDAPEEDAIKDKDEKDEEEQEDAIHQEITELKSIQNEMDQYIDEKDLAEELGTKLTDEGLLITIMTDISFDSGSAKVREQGRDIAEELSKVIVTDPPHQIVISGHADDRPMNNHEFQSNWELSVMRAVNFMGMLLENEELNSERFSAKGYGEHHPIVPNTSEKNRAKNRRVEVLVLPNVEIQIDE